MTRQAWRERCHHHSARYGSTRLPGKPLLDIAGKPMIQHVYSVPVRCAA
jgi:3-deoxy-manno-octulosonate cytidylyltransferase (CMP-KDO synthetase)